MTGNRKDDREALDRLATAIVDDLLKASDDEVAADLLAEGRNPTEEAEAMRALIERAARRCGKSRLQAAKIRLVIANKSHSQIVGQVDMAEARRRLASMLLHNQGTGLSMAARNETELSDNDVLGMLADFEELGALPNSKPSEPDS